MRRREARIEPQRLLKFRDRIVHPRPRLQFVGLQISAALRVIILRSRLAAAGRSNCVPIVRRQRNLQQLGDGLGQIVLQFKGIANRPGNLPRPLLMLRARVGQAGNHAYVIAAHLYVPSPPGPLQIAGAPRAPIGCAPAARLRRHDPKRILEIAHGAQIGGDRHHQPEPEGLRTAIVADIREWQYRQPSGRVAGARMECNQNPATAAMAVISAANAATRTARLRFSVPGSRFGTREIVSA